MRAWQRLWLPPLVFGLSAAAALEVYVRTAHVPNLELLLPRPSAVAADLWIDRGPLLSGLWVTSLEALTAFAASSVCGIIIAIALASSSWARRAVYPYTVLLQTVPIIAIAPMLVIWIGPGFAGVTVSAFIVSIFPVITNTLTGLTGTDPGLVDLFRLYNASRTATLFKLRLPFATPEIVTGLRVAGGLAVIGAVVAEALVGEIGEDVEGLGIKIVSAARNARPERVFAGVLVASMLGIGLFAAVNAAGYFLLRRWHASFAAGRDGQL